MSLTRRELLELSILALGAAACGSSSDSGGSPGAGHCLANGTSAAIGANHGHALTVTKADVAAGLDKTYDIQGSSLHAHSVTITAAMFAQLAANTAVSATSTVAAAHDHAITVTCV
jgi:hypothetical protein